MDSESQASVSKEFKLCPYLWKVHQKQQLVFFPTKKLLINTKPFFAFSMELFGPYKV